MDLEKFEVAVLRGREEIRETGNQGIAHVCANLDKGGRSWPGHVRLPWRWRTHGGVEDNDGVQVLGWTAVKDELRKLKRGGGFKEELWARGIDRTRTDDGELRGMRVWQQGEKD